MAKKQKSKYTKELEKSQRRFYSSLGSKQQTIPHIVSKIKNKANLHELVTLSSTKRLSFIERFFYANPLPKSYKNLANYTKSHYVNSANTLVQEVDWCIFAFRKYSLEIKLFLKYKKEYEKAFLLGNYKEACTYLEKIENEICCSIWSLENRFLLVEYEKGTDSNKEYLNLFNETNFNEDKLKSSTISHLAHFFSQKVESKLTVSQYNTDISKAIKSSNLPIEWEEYYYFKLNFWEGKYSKLHKIISIEGRHSIIDRYLTVIKTLKLTLSNKLDFSVELQEHWLSRLKSLYKLIKDDSVLSLISIFQPKIFSIEGQKSYDLNALDDFTSELYQPARISLRNAIIKKPNNFDYYVPYLLSFIYDKLQFIEESKDSAKNMILLELYNVLNRKEDPHTTQINLERFCKNLSTFSITEGLYDFIISNNSNIQIKTIWQKSYCSFCRPYFSPFCAIDLEKGKIYIENLIRIKPNSSSINFEKAKLIDDTAIIDFIDQLNKSSVKLVSLGQFWQNLNDFSKAKTIWIKLFEENLHLIPIQEIAIKNVFYCHVQLNELNTAIDIYSNILVKNPFLVYAIDCSEIREKIEKSDFKKIEKNINLPIFYNNSGADENTIQFTSEMLLNEMGKDLPSEIDWLKKDIDKHKTIHYLYNVCRPEILHESDFIEGTNACYSERIKICRLLLNFNEIEDCKHIFEYEIESCLKYLTTLEGLEQVNNGKIYADEKGLLKELSEYEGLYHRYRAVANIVNNNQNNKIFILNTKGNLVTKNEGKNDYSEHPLMDVFENIFEVVIDRFLYSPSGISAYLSTRIRHGAVLGELRPIFHRAGLVSQKKAGSEIYKDIPYWNRPNISSENQKKMQNILKILSEKVDTRISNLIKENLQIKTTKKNINGWFNYDFGFEELAQYSISLSTTNTYTEFIYFLIDILWWRTEKNLEKIRDLLENNVKQDFENILKETRGDCEKIVSRKDLPELYTNFTACSTNIQKAISNVSKWFQRTGSEIANFGINKLIDVIEADVARRYVMKKMTLLKSVDAECEIKGAYYKHFVDLISIFVNNAMEHSEDSIRIIKVNINVIREKDKLIIKIINENPNEIHFQRLLSKGVDRKDEALIIGEYHSGLPKANKILKRDLNDFTNEYKIEKQGNKFCVTLLINIEPLII